jgi:hypothetical protein
MFITGTGAAVVLPVMLKLYGFSLKSLLAIDMFALYVPTLDEFILMTNVVVPLAATELAASVCNVNALSPVNVTLGLSDNVRLAFPVFWIVNVTSLLFPVCAEPILYPDEPSAILVDPSIMFISEPLAVAVKVKL